MPALVSSREDEEGGDVKPDSEASDSGSEGSNDRLLSDASCTPDASSASGPTHGPMEPRKNVTRTSVAQPAQPSTSAGNPASGGEQSSTLAEDLAAAAAAGHAALSTVDWEATTGAAINQAIKAGKAALAAGATDEEAKTAAHEVAGTVLGLSPGRRARWRATDAALIVEGHIVGTRTQRFGTKEEKDDLAAIVASRRQHTLLTPPHENPQDGEI